MDHSPVGPPHRGVYIAQASLRLKLTIVIQTWFVCVLLVALGGFLGAWFGAANIPRGHSFYPTHSQPGRPTLSLVYAIVWLVTLANLCGVKTMFLGQVLVMSNPCLEARLWLPRATN